MTDVLRRLDDFRVEVHHNLTLGPFADRDLEVVNDDGNQPVVVALDDERLAVLLRRVQNMGGYANVFIKGDKGVRYVAVVDGEGAIDPESAEDLGAVNEAERPSAEVTIGVFLDYLELRPNGVRLPARLGETESPPVVRAPQEVPFA